MPTVLDAVTAPMTNAAEAVSDAPLLFASILATCATTSTTSASLESSLLSNSLTNVPKSKVTTCSATVPAAAAERLLPAI